MKKVALVISPAFFCAVASANTFSAHADSNECTAIKAFLEGTNQENALNQKESLKTAAELGLEFKAQDFVSPESIAPLGSLHPNTVFTRSISHFKNGTFEIPSHIHRALPEINKALNSKTNFQNCNLPEQFGSGAAAKSKTESIVQESIVLYSAPILAIWQRDPNRERDFYIGRYSVNAFSSIWFSEDRDMAIFHAETISGPGYFGKTLSGRFVIMENKFGSWKISATSTTLFKKEDIHSFD